MKEALFEQRYRISDPDIQAFVEHALNAAPRGFWTCPCSSSGTHHPPEDNGESGTVRHLIKSAAVSEQLARFYDLDQRDTDIAIAGAMIHDIKKNGEPWTNKTDYTHGWIAYDWLEQFELKEPEKESIRNCVRYHMARWVQPESEKPRALKPTTPELVVQLTDYFCSRECASFFPGVGVDMDLVAKL